MRARYSCDDRGFSLVELIVVILIMGVVTGGAIIAVSTIYNADAERAAKRVVSLMSVARSKALALEDSSTSYITFKLECDSNGNYYAGVYDSAGNIIEPGEPQLISNYRLSINAAKKNKTGPTEITATTGPIVFRFEKATGGIRSVSFNGDVITRADEDHMYLDLVFSGSEEFRVISVPATGRSYIK